MKLTRNQWIVFCVVCFIGIFANLDKSMIGFTADKLISTYGFTKAEMGNLSSVFYISFIIVTIPGGWLVDRFGYKKFVVISLAILMVFSFLFGNVSSLGAILLLRFLVGFGQAGYTNGAPKIISEHYEGGQCAKIQSFVIATAGVGGILASTVGEGLINSNWHHAYYFLSAGYLIALLAVLFLMKENHNANGGKHETAKLKAGFFDAWKNKNTLLLAIAVLFSNLVGVAMLFWLPNVLRVNLGVSDQGTLSKIMVVFYIVMTIATAVSGAVITRYFKGKEQKFIFAFSIITAVCLIIFITSHTYPVAMGALYITVFAMMISFAALLSIPYQLVPKHIIGAAFAVLNIGAFVGGIISPQLVSAFAQSDSYVHSFICLGICMVISGVCALLVRRPEENEN